ncbi:MAG: class I SAM-dependent methyltransferase [Actinomycetota bacterium]
MTTERTQHARRLFAPLPRTYDRMGALLSFGQDPRWRRFLVSRVPGDAALLLDVAAGTAAVAIEALRTGSKRTVVCVDQSEPMLRTGAERVARAGLGHRSTFVLAHAERLPFAPSTFDALTFTYLFRYVEDPAATLRGLVEAVKPGGIIASLEFGVPPNTVWYAPWWLYTRVAMPALGLAASNGWYEVGRFLGPSISAFDLRFPIHTQLRMWREAGVDPVSVRRMSFGAGVVIWGRRAA